MTNHSPTHRRPLGGVAWPELDGRAPVLLVPLGSCEQHGPHLPLGTDTIIATEVADRAAEALSTMGVDPLVTPPIEITASGEHQGFPGTLSIGTEAMAAVLTELVRSADWAGGLVFVNGHGGNQAAVTSATLLARHEGRRVLAWWPAPPHESGPTDLHAGHIETSVMLAIAPHLVRGEPADVAPVTLDADQLARLMADGVASVSPTGVLGDPRPASAARGSALLDGWVTDLVDRVAAWQTGISTAPAIERP